MRIGTLGDLSVCPPIRFCGSWQAKLLRPACYRSAGSIGYAGSCSGGSRPDYSLTSTRRPAWPTKIGPPKGVGCLLEECRLLPALQHYGTRSCGHWLVTETHHMLSASAQALEAWSVRSRQCQRLVISLLRSPWASTCRAAGFVRAERGNGGSRNCHCPESRSAST